MVSLIVKDFIIHKKMLLAMLLGIIVYMFLNASVILVGIIFTLAIVMHIFSYDEKKSIQMLLSSLPYTRREIVSSKYISTFIYILLVIGAIVISNFFVNEQLPNWKQFIIVIGIVVLVLSFLFPFSYQFTSKYLLIGSFSFFGIYLLIGKFLVPNINDEIRSIIAKILEFNNTQIVIGAGIMLSILYLLSWLLSIRIYEKKVF